MGGARRPGSRRALLAVRRSSQRASQGGVELTDGLVAEVEEVGVEERQVVVRSSAPAMFAPTCLPWLLAWSSCSTRNSPPSAATRETGDVAGREHSSRPPTRPTRRRRCRSSTGKPASAASSTFGSMPSPPRPRPPRAFDRPRSPTRPPLDPVTDVSAVPRRRGAVVVGQGADSSAGKMRAPIPGSGNTIVTGLPFRLAPPRSRSR